MYNLNTLRSKRFPMQRTESNFTGNLQPNAVIYHQINKFKIIIKIILFKKLCGPYAHTLGLFGAPSFRFCHLRDSFRFPHSLVFLTLEIRHTPKRRKYDTVNELKSLSFTLQLCLITNDISM